MEKKQIGHMLARLRMFLLVRIMGTINFAKDFPEWIGFPDPEILGDEVLQLDGELERALCHPEARAKVCECNLDNVGVLGFVSHQEGTSIDLKVCSHDQKLLLFFFFFHKKDF